MAAFVSNVGKAGCSSLGDACSFFPFSAEPARCVWVGGPAAGAETADLPTSGYSVCPVFVCSLP